MTTISAFEIAGFSLLEKSVGKLRFFWFFATITSKVITLNPPLLPLFFDFTDNRYLKTPPPKSVGVDLGKLSINNNKSESIETNFFLYRLRFELKTEVKKSAIFI